MQTKDYYKILEVPPSATLNEIKSAYRRLAHQFHPDKNGNDPYAAAQFEVIKEAYEVLSNPSRKEYYLQHRWYDRAMNKKETPITVTPVIVLKQFLELDKYVARVDAHRIDHQGLYEYISYILPDATIEKLNSFKEMDINDSIVELALKAGRHLPINYASPVSRRLMKLNMNQSSLEKIRQFMAHSSRVASWNRYKIWLIVLIVLLICGLIYAIGS